MTQAKGPLDNLFQIIIVAIIVAALIWVFILEPVIAWISQNIFILAIAGVLLFIGIASFYSYRKKQIAEQERQIQHKIEEERRRREAFEARQRAKGLEKFVDGGGRERWGTQEEVSSWKKEEELFSREEIFFNEVLGAIQEFQPKWRYDVNEQYFHDNLFSYLSGKFSNSRYPVRHEPTIDESRPDIDIGKIAIEVKGPTTIQDLKTLPDKILKYIDPDDPKKWERMIIVLFDPLYLPENFLAMKQRIKKMWPKVEIIEKKRPQ